MHSSRVGSLPTSCTAAPSSMAPVRCRPGPSLHHLLQTHLQPSKPLLFSLPNRPLASTLTPTHPLARLLAWRIGVSVELVFGWKVGCPTRWKPTSVQALRPLHSSRSSIASVPRPT